jgi:hypothetical protein
LKNCGKKALTSCINFIQISGNCLLLFGLFPGEKYFLSFLKTVAKNLDLALF